MPVSGASTAGVTGLCLHPADLAISKLAAGRDKDLAFAGALLRHRLVERAELEERLGELDDEARALVERRLAAL